jgi:CTP synthase
VRETYGEARIEERHRHRYEVNNTYRDQLAGAGLVFSGVNPDLDLVEFVELPRDVHPYYVATQAHPSCVRDPPVRTRCFRPRRRGHRATALRALPARRSGLRRKDEGAEDMTPDRPEVRGGGPAGSGRARTSRAELVAGVGDQAGVVGCGLAA